MRLPVPYNSYITPPTCYPPGNPPMYFQIAVLSEVEGLVYDISAQLANEASEKAGSNPARTVAYNILATNAWKNQDYHDLIKLTCDYVCWRIRRRDYITIPQLVNDCCTEILTLYTSSMVSNFPELRAVSEQRTLDAAAQNGPVFVNLKMELEAMYQQRPGQMHQGFVGNGNPAMYPAHSQPQMVPAHLVPAHQMQGHPSHYPQHQFHQVQAPAPAMMSAGSTWGGGGQASASPTEARFTGRSFPQNRVADAPAAIPAAAPAPEVEPELIITGGSEVDRARHQIVYFGQSYSMPGQGKYDRLKQASEEIVAKRVPNEETSPADKYVNKVWSIEPTLEEAIAAGRQQFIARSEDGVPPPMLRYFAMALNIIHTPVDVRDYIKSLSTATDLVSLGQKMRALAEAVGARESIETAEALVTALCSIDRLLTDLVNDFLINQLRFKGTGIDLFSEDILELPGYLAGKYGPSHTNAFMSFSRSTIERLFANVPDHLLAEYVEEENANFCIFPIYYTLTFLQSNERDLGYEVGEKAVFIDGLKAPVLYNLCHSLGSHARMVEMEASYDLLITADNVRYGLYNSAFQVGRFMINKK